MSSDEYRLRPWSTGHTTPPGDAAAERGHTGDPRIDNESEDDQIGPEIFNWIGPRRLRRPLSPWTHHFVHRSGASRRDRPRTSAHRSPYCLTEGAARVRFRPS